MTPETTTSPPKSTNTGMGSSVSPSPRDTDRTMTTPSMAFSTPEDAIPSSGTGTPTVPEKSALTPPSSTLDTVSDTSKPLPVTTLTVTITSSPTTDTTPRTTVLGTATTEAQEKNTATVPQSPATIPPTSKPPDTHHSTVTQTPSQAAQTASDVSMTPETTTSPPKSTNTGMGSSVSPSPRDTDRTMTTPSMAFSTPEDAIPSSGTGTPTVPEKSALTPPSSTLDTVSDTSKPLLVTTLTVTITSSPTTDTTPRTTVLGTATSEAQEKNTATVPPSPATTPTTTAIVLRSSETTKSSTMIGTNPAPLNSSQSLDGGACALDEYPHSTRGCMCNDSHYSHLELSRDVATLRCRPQDIEVALKSCFLKTHHWVLKDDAFSRCFSINTIEQGRRVQVFQLEKKEGACGLHISTNVSHALHSLDVHLEQALPGSPSTGFRVLHFSCAYPLVVNVSKPVSYQETSIPTIHIPSTGETVITLSIFTDSHLSTPLKNSTAPVGMPLYVVLKSTSSDPGRFALVANEVFASTDLSNTVTKATYHFVKGSCPVQGRLLQDLSNGASRQVILAFTLSRFLNSDTLYLHAQVTLCDKQAPRPCQPSCSGKNPRRRNSPWASPAKTRLEDGDSKWIVFGPLQISAPRASSSRSRAGAWMSVLLLMLIGRMLD
ncbi:uncharacterized protein LOC118578003 [Onychomys torridus]|uniref:uncharacterized protein LOC118578003 n=1 Tax=Onychomys torridus TaxID=38674 RepID=UPI00167F7DD2|nr:uncharacterized protein LOC118578003 [Onychomys torridus]